jgi:hypothetical protein
MDLEKYKVALDSARKALEEMLKARAVLDEQIPKVEAVVTSLSDLCDPPQDFPPLSAVESAKIPPEFPIHLRGAIIEVLHAASPKPLSPTEVRDKLKEMNFPLDRYAFEMPPIHNAINRLLQADEIESVVADGVQKYKRLGLLARVLRRAEQEEKRSKLTDIPGEGDSLE